MPNHVHSFIYTDEEHPRKNTVYIEKTRTYGEETLKATVSFPYHNFSLTGDKPRLLALALAIQNHYLGYPAYEG